MLCPCIGLGLLLQQDDVIVEGNNAISLIRQLIELSEIALQTFALFSKCLKPVSYTHLTLPTIYSV